MTMIKVNKNHVHAIGRRKRASARVFLQPGSGLVNVNRQTVEDYFGDADKAINRILEPLRILALDGQFDVFATTTGGGVTGQVDAIRLAVARALVLVEEKEKGVSSQQAATDSEADDGEAANTHPWHKILRHEGMLTRDSRIVLRKLVGRRKARKKEQYSKR